MEPLSIHTFFTHCECEHFITDTFVSYIIKNLFSWIHIPMIPIVTQLIISFEVILFWTNLTDISLSSHFFFNAITFHPYFHLSVIIKWQDCHHFSSSSFLLSKIHLKPECQTEWGTKEICKTKTFFFRNYYRLTFFSLQQCFFFFFERKRNKIGFIDIFAMQFFVYGIKININYINNSRIFRLFFLLTLRNNSIFFRSWNKNKRTDVR